MLINVFTNNSVDGWDPVAGFSLRQGSDTEDAEYDVLSTVDGATTFPSEYDALNSFTLVFAVTIK
jgi:hypothetical protein